MARDVWLLRHTDMRGIERVDAIVKRLGETDLFTLTNTEKAAIATTVTNASKVRKPVMIIIENAALRSNGCNGEAGLLYIFTDKCRLWADFDEKGCS